MQSKERIRIVVQKLRQWYAHHKRDLPWRDIKTRDDTERAYQILVSEIMLQQTQVSRVKIVFKDFLSKFPELKHLAAASNKDVILAWRGMGYNNRALRLRDAARVVEGKSFPREMDALQMLPGVGHYTAAAVRNFAFNIPTPCLDTNIRRILHRAFAGPEYTDGTWKKDDAYLLAIAKQLLANAVDTKQFDARNWHAALMDFGSLVCTKRNPKWDVCPLVQAGVMKAAYKTLPANPSPKKIKQEPGRMVGSTYIPNRIFRGRVIDELRDAKSGLTEAEIGKRICIDWSPQDHAVWLHALITSLKNDHLVRHRGARIVLAD